MSTPELANLSLARGAKARFERWLINGFAVLLMGALLQDALPGDSPARTSLRQLCGQVLYPLGLWQGDWKLFAPDPKRTNAWIEAKVTFRNGESGSWKSPDWEQQSAGDEILQGRHAKWWDALRRDDSRVLWPALARFAASRLARPERGLVPARVELVRHWWDVPNPGAPNYFGRAIPGQTVFPHQYLFHVEVLP
ncbi:MAG: hypothetical protein QM778_29020 [Myxococcales bacterium]